MAGPLIKKKENFLTKHLPQWLGDALNDPSNIATTGLPVAGISVVTSKIAAHAALNELVNRLLSELPSKARTAFGQFTGLPGGKRFDNHRTAVTQAVRETDVGKDMPNIIESLLGREFPVWRGAKARRNFELPDEPRSFSLSPGESEGWAMQYPREAGYRHANPSVERNSGVLWKGRGTPEQVEWPGMSSEFELVMTPNKVAEMKPARVYVPSSNFTTFKDYTGKEHTRRNVDQMNPIDWLRQYGK